MPPPRFHPKGNMLQPVQPNEMLYFMTRSMDSAFTTVSIRAPDDLKGHPDFNVAADTEDLANQIMAYYHPMAKSDWHDKLINPFVSIDWVENGFTYGRWAFRSADAQSHHLAVAKYPIVHNDVLEDRLMAYGTEFLVPICRWRNHGADEWLNFRIVRTVDLPNSRNKYYHIEYTNRKRIPPGTKVTPENILAEQRLNKGVLNAPHAAGKIRSASDALAKALANKLIFAGCKRRKTLFDKDILNYVINIVERDSDYGMSIRLTFHRNASYNWHWTIIDKIYPSWYKLSEAKKVIKLISPFCVYFVRLLLEEIKGGKESQAKKLLNKILKLMSKDKAVAKKIKAYLDPRLRKIKRETKQPKETTNGSTTNGTVQGTPDTNLE